MQFRTETGRPSQRRLDINKFGTIGRIWIVGLLRGNGKTPDVTLVFCRAIGLDFVDSPVVRRTGNQTVRIGKSWKADNEKRPGLVALERIAGPIIDVIKILAEINIMRGSGLSREPGEGRPRIQVDRAVRRAGLGGGCGRRRYYGIFIIGIGGRIAGTVGPHEDIPEHGIIALPVKDVHRVLTILKFFGMTLYVPALGPAPGRSDIDLKNSVICIVKRRSIPSGKGRTSWNFRVVRITLHKHIIRCIAGIDLACPEIPGPALAAGPADIECPANHPPGAARPGDGLAERTIRVNHRIVLITFRIALIERLGFKPDLVAASMLGDFKCFHCISTPCYEQQGDNHTEVNVFGRLTEHLSSSFRFLRLCNLFLVRS